MVGVDRSVSGVDVFMSSFIQTTILFYIVLQSSPTSPNYSYHVACWITICGDFFMLSVFVLECFRLLAVLHVTVYICYCTATVGDDTYIVGVDRHVIGVDVFMSLFILATIQFYIALLSSPLHKIFCLSSL